MHHLRNLVTVACIIASYQSHAIFATTGMVVATNAASMQQQEAINTQQQMLLATTKTGSIVTGAMTCKPTYRNIPGQDAYDMSGCKTSAGVVSIQKFFEQNRTNDNQEIIQIIYNDHVTRFIIYYGVK